ncbi:GtrA family protein [Paenibacillus nitricinens]|uniref:GtrA family protein n=1 Tax=Paenibacillus nitricinens TaxID=3367691 RepID=UPI003F83F8BD
MFYLTGSTVSNEKKQKNIKNIIEFIKYGFWGAVTTGINLLAFFWLESLGMYYIVANIVSYIFAVFVNYILNKKFVFKSDSSEYKDGKQLIKFFIVRLVSLLIDNILFYLLVSALHYNVNFSRVFLSLAIIIATFGVNKLFVFNTKKR